MGGGQGFGSAGTATISVGEAADTKSCGGNTGIASIPVGEAPDTKSGGARTGVIASISVGEAADAAATHDNPLPEQPEI
jgi:hypothetical protein